LWPQIQLLFENDKKKIEYAKKKQLLQILYTGIAVIFAKIDSLFGKKRVIPHRKLLQFCLWRILILPKNSVKWGKVEYDE